MKNKVIKMIISFAAAAAISGCTLLGTNSRRISKTKIIRRLCSICVMQKRQGLRIPRWIF